MLHYLDMYTQELIIALVRDLRKAGRESGFEHFLEIQETIDALWRLQDRLRMEKLSWE